VFAGGESIFTETYWEFPPTDESLLPKWTRVQEVRRFCNIAIEGKRSDGQLGSSLQAELKLRVASADLALLQSLGDDLKFVFIVSAAEVNAASAGDNVEDGEAIIDVIASPSPKCERCWHYRSDVGRDPAHPAICGRCVSNLFGTGEQRTVA
jgi:isoleucyl-tRNA synthetase